MIIKKQDPLIFRSVLWLPSNGRLRVSEPFLAEAILWYLTEKYNKKPCYREKTIYLHGNYPAISLFQEKIHIHRLIMMYKIGRMLKRDEYVHHIDGNRFNCLRSNLEIRHSSEHQSYHRKGKKQTKEHVMKRIDATTKTRYGHSIYENPELLEGL